MAVLDIAGPQLPAIVYWGSDLGELSGAEMAVLPLAARLLQGADAADRAPVFSLSPTRAAGWSGWPGLSGHRRGMASQPLFSLQKVAGAPVAGPGEAGVAAVSYRGVDAAAQLVLEGQLELTADGVLRHRQTLTSTASPGAACYELSDLLTLLPVPEGTTELLDFAGRWANEAQLQHHEISQGTWLREQRHGRTGPDTPLVLFAGTKGFGFRQGEVWGVHLGWSGDQRYLAQRLNNGTALIGAGEILAPGEVALGPGESATTPWTYAVYSAEGVDGASARLHSMLRRRPGHPVRPRPVMFNTWEAVGFGQSLGRLAELADIAAAVGVEMFVVDDGWFASRRDDLTGLGDWYVADEIWPQGLGPIVDHVRSLGMGFGLWFEPEMVNPASDLALSHPDWIMGTAGRMPPTGRHQQVLDIANPDAFAFILGRMSSLVSEYGINFIKWDHNRDIADPVHRGGPRAGYPAVRDQTLATYRLMDELRARHSGLEIESCSSGGSRIDLGVLQRTDRVWASDCIDPIERARIVPGIATLLPLELIGTHVAAGRSKTTGRQHDLGLRLIVALFGHQGIEWDIVSASAEERQALAQWVALAKSLQPLLHTGRLVRIERPADPGTSLFGVVAQDRSEAMFTLVRSSTSPSSGTPPLRLDGLDPAARYSLRWLWLPGDGPEAVEANRAGLPGTYADGEEIVARGALLMSAGTEAPYLQPEEAALLHLAKWGG